MIGKLDRRITNPRLVRRALGDSDGTIDHSADGEGWSLKDKSFLNISYFLL
jgi:hypothetical protein